MDKKIENSMLQVASGRCATFSRKFAGLEAAAEAVEQSDHWFRDLLSLWRPSGHPSGKLGLRLAVRDGYLNFYRKGQSVARVEFKSGRLVAHTHLKYVNPSSSSVGQGYAKLESKEIKFGSTTIPYEGLPTLESWIKRIDGIEGKGYVGVEKELVDRLVEVNDHVIDLEMALPSWSMQKTAPRIDLVTLDGGTIVFWEVKTAGDSRIRCRAPFEKDRYPEVLKQLAQYRKFLVQDFHREQIAAAYAETAKVLVKLRTLADSIGDRFALSRVIEQASKDQPLKVADLAGLAVVSEQADGSGLWRSWKHTHEAKLQGRVPVLSILQPERLVYSTALSTMDFATD